MRIIFEILSRTTSVLTLLSLLGLMASMTACSSIESLSELDGQRKRSQAEGEASQDAKDAASDLPDGVITLQHQLSWRAQSLAANPSFDPRLRPRRLPRAFVQVPWSYDIPLISPRMEAVLTSDFGWRNLYGRIDYHSGIDISPRPSTRTYTPVSGEILYVKRNGTDSGVVISDGDRQHTFWHIRPARGLRKGHWISSGSVVGTMIPWGSRTHLHYSVHLTGPTKSAKDRNDTNAIDPLTLVRRLQESATPKPEAAPEPEPEPEPTISSLLIRAFQRSQIIEAAQTPVAPLAFKRRQREAPTTSGLAYDAQTDSRRADLAANGYSLLSLMQVR